MAKPIWMVKWLNYEYWPTWLFYIPIAPYLFYLGLRSKSFTFFTNVNPVWKDGGMVYYNKDLINQLLPRELRPQCIFATKGQYSDDDFKNISYPVIVKPAAGERGKNVAKIEKYDDLIAYLKKCNSDQIIESFINLPYEAGVFVVRHPDRVVEITSLTTKEFLYVVGDGKSSVLELMKLSDRARIQIHRFASTILSNKPKANELLLLEPIGNHNRGTRFINANHKIDNQLKTVFKEVIENIPSFNYGRFDIKYSTWDDLCNNRNWLIIEVNGVNSEPTHIYDQKTGYLPSLIDLCRHWKMISDISIDQKKKGVKPLSLLEFIMYYRSKNKSN